MADTSKRAGWYPDPDGTLGERWWNGAGWSESRRGGAVASAPAVVQAAVPTQQTVPVPAPAAPVIYSAANPAPQSPADATGRASVWGTAVLSSAPGRTIDVSVNRDAFYGFVAGLISIFFNLFFALSIVAVIFSIRGIARARQLQAQGATTTLMGLAVAGLAMGALSTVIALVGFLIFFVGAFTFNVN